MNSEIDLQFKEEVYLYLSGQLNQDEIDELWAEALEDGKKMNYLKTVANVKMFSGKNDLDTENDTHQNAGGYYLLHPKHYVAAALISVLIGVLAFISLPTSNSSIAPKQINPIESVSIDYYRSGNSTSAVDDIIAEAVTTYNDGNIDEAYTLLNKHIEDGTHGEEAKIALKLQLGKIHYNEEEYDKAQSLFTDIVTSSETFNTKEKAMWFLANSYLQSSRVDSENALEVLEKISVMKGAHSRMAESMLKNIEKN